MQEKNRLITELKSVKTHYQKYEPAIQALQRKYQAALKEKMMMSLDRNRLKDANAALKQQLQEALAAREAPQDMIKGACAALLLALVLRLAIVIESGLSCILGPQRNSLLAHFHSTYVYPGSLSHAW